LESVKIEGDTATLKIGPRLFTLQIQSALGLFGIASVPQGVRPGVFLSICTDAAEGKRVRYFLNGGSISGLEFQ
jgi:hypothetical protein